MGQHLQDQNFYEILEVTPDALQDEIHRAYQRAKETYNPDSASLYTMFTREEAYEVLKLIDEAFATLSNQSRRRDYDVKLKQNAKMASGGARREDFPSTQEAMAALPDVLYSATPEIPVSVSNRISTTAAPAKPSVVRSNFNESRPQAESQLPEGFRRTRFSVYEVDPKLEKEISEAVVWEGPWIQKIRLYKKVTLEHISEETRISRTYLAALETSDYQALPAPVFVRGFVVQVAKILGLDAEKVAKSYIEIMKKGLERS